MSNSQNYGNVKPGDKLAPRLTCELEGTGKPVFFCVYNHNAMPNNTTNQLEANTTAIAVIKNDMDYLKRKSDDILAEIKSLRKEFVRRDEVTQLEDRMSKIEKDTKERFGKYDSWASWFLKIILGAIIVTLLALIGMQP